MSKYQNTKAFLLKDTPKICQKKFSLLEKLKTQLLRLMLLVTWMVQELLEHFLKKKNCKVIEKEYKIENRKKSN